MRITPQSVTTTQLFSNSNEQYCIPAYQRRYSWTKKQLWELLDDIKFLDGQDMHLLGTIVCLAGDHVGGMNKLELVDGQQRLTTVIILMKCILDRFHLDGKDSLVQGVSGLLEARAFGASPIPKLALDSLDAQEFKRLSNGETSESPENPHLQDAFVLYRQWVKDQKEEMLKGFLYKLQNQAMFIRLDVGHAKDAFKLFETINNRGLRLSPTDIIKNFLLGNAARFGQEHLEFSRDRWGELLKRLDGASSEPFFRHFISANLRRRVTSSFVILYFQMIFMRNVEEAARLPDNHWNIRDDSTDDEEPDDENDLIEDELDNESTTSEPAQRIPFTAFMDNLVKCARMYGEIVRADTGNRQIDRHLRNLRMIKSVQTYGFLMHIRVNGCSDADFLAILKLTESFLVRRHICKTRANETDTAFAKLCDIDSSKPLEMVKTVYRDYSPSDEKFKDAFATFAFGPNLIERARYCLERFEANRHGAYPELFVGGTDTVHVEHIIPQKIKSRRAKEESGNWTEYLGPGSDTQHPKYVDRIGNMTLFAGSLNIAASNNPYGPKKEAYSKSAIKLTNQLPTDYPEFGFLQIEHRSKEFAKEATQCWPIP